MLTSWKIRDLFSRGTQFASSSLGKPELSNESCISAHNSQKSFVSVCLSHLHAAVAVSEMLH